MPIAKFPSKVHSIGMNDSLYLSASCVVGAERVLAHEIELLGMKATERSAGRVYFNADSREIARALVNLRTADRLFLQFGSFPAADFDELFEGALALPWERLAAKTDSIVIEKARCNRSKIDSQSTVQAMVQKAAYERIAQAYKLGRPAATGAQVTARVRIEADQATVEVDLSGDALSRRGYRRLPTEAPLKESLAAALLFMAGWKRSFPLHDLFCGSGTIPIEAALYALDIAPGLKRHFTWETMPIGNILHMKEEKDRAQAKIQMDREVYIAGSDADASTVKAAVANAGTAGVATKIKFFSSKAEDATPLAEKGFLFADPPYGKRLGSPEESNALYARLADLPKKFAGWNICFVVDREDFGKSWSRTGAKHTKLVDGAEVRYFHRFQAQ